MEERKIDFAPVSFLYTYYALKALTISYMQEYNPSDKKFYSWPVTAPGTWGDGDTPEASVNAMIAAMKESAQILQEPPEKIEKDRRAYYAKIIISTPEEIKSCLVGPICEDI